MPTTSKLDTSTPLGSTEAVHWSFELDEPLQLPACGERVVSWIIASARLVHANDAFSKLYGFSRASELIGSPLGRFWPDGENTGRALVRSLLAHRKPEYAALTVERDRWNRDVLFLNQFKTTLLDGALLRVEGTQREVGAGLGALDPRPLEATNPTSLERHLAELGSNFLQTEVLR